MTSYSTVSVPEQLNDISIYLFDNDESSRGANQQIQLNKNIQHKFQPSTGLPIEPVPPHYEPNQTSTDKNIKRTQINRDMRQFSLKKNSNLSKELRLLFVAYYEKYIYLYRDGEYESTKKQLEALEKRGINFNTYTLVDLFGVMHRDTPEVRARNRSNARILRRILTEEGLEIILKGKALHKMTYLFGFEKYACRLAHGKLSGRIQAK